MRSIGRDEEFQRAADRVDALRSRRERKVHFAVAAPPHGGLSLFLSDLAEATRAAGDLVLVRTLDDSRRVEDMFVSIGRELAESVGGPVVGAEGNIETLLQLGRRLTEKLPGRIAVLVLDVAPALRGIAEDPQLRRDVLGNPLLQKLRTLVNLLQDQEPPMAVVLGWDDHFREHAPDWRALDVVQRYPQINLFADHGIGREAMGLFPRNFRR